MHARLDRGAVRLLTRTGLDWTHRRHLQIQSPPGTLERELDGLGRKFNRIQLSRGDTKERDTSFHVILQIALFGIGLILPEAFGFLG